MLSNMPEMLEKNAAGKITGGSGRAVFPYDVRCLAPADDEALTSGELKGSGRFEEGVMLVSDGIAARMSARGEVDAEGAGGWLPHQLKRDRAGVRAGLLRRLAASRLFALGDRAGVLKAAQRRSGRAFQLDIRQRVIVKALVSRHMGAGAARGAALARHVAYLGRAGAGAEGARPAFFDRDQDGVDAATAVAGWSGDRHHFRFIVSPEHGDRIADLPAYVREVMRRVAADLGEPSLTWLATAHFDTDQPHAHVLVRGRRADGPDLVIPRDYVAYGLRARAQEVAQERLGELSRADAERRVWRETQADRFTGFDRRLLAIADADGWVEDPGGRGGAWAALTRGRLLHLERLGLSVRSGAGHRLAPDLERQLRALQLRTDIIRTLNQRRLEGAIAIRSMGPERIRGEVVRSGFHDELGARPYAVLRDANGLEHYAALAQGQVPPRQGARIALSMTGRGAVISGGLSRDGQAL
jgi:type IV secretory pathway VirD2 relaxase